MSDTKAVIKSADMSEEMQQEAIECSTQALEKFNIEKDIASHIKREFDKKYGVTWHCVVGRNFGSYVTHESVCAVLQVMIIVFFGFCLTKLGYFSNDKQKWLSKLNMVFFTPCLLFSNIASTISLEKLLAFWPIPVFYIVFAGFSYTLSQLTSRLVGLNRPYRRFVTACVMFSNTNSLPIAIISSLAVSEAGKILFWDADDTKDSVAARGISYTLFFAIFGNLLRWSYGYSLLRKDETDEDEISESDSDTLDGDRLVVPTSTYDETTNLLSTFPTLPTINSPNNNDDPTATKSSFLKMSHDHVLVRIAKRIHRFMSPPLYAAFLGLFVGLTPLKHLMYDHDSFLYPCFTKAIQVCGHAAVPIILTCLGAQLTMIAQSQQPAQPAMKAPVFTAILVRMIFMPFVAIPIAIAFVVYGSSWSLLATDPVFITMMIVLGCTPTAINLVQITQVNGLFEEEMLRMLFWSYGVVCVPVCTILVFVALSIVDKLV
ncbi:dynein light chain 1, cytoplasmic [Phascolomyces articulosus]|uniref:Dynein light chain 1, cytoplasmic n=1 Tax=Phascolomyces articulosus TaxID=60185 RepID=A0AAD5KBV6_9FUNG|nr:dynein light chain 1, cytoplasmic [Phascolomyces articulosus]